MPPDRRISITEGEFTTIDITSTAQPAEVTAWEGPPRGFFLTLDGRQVTYAAAPTRCKNAGRMRRGVSREHRSTRHRSRRAATATSSASSGDEPGEPGPRKRRFRAGVAA